MWLDSSEFRFAVADAQEDSGVERKTALAAAC
jgi:hypothetical protein